MAYPHLALCTRLAGYGEDAIHRNAGVGRLMMTGEGVTDESAEGYTSQRGPGGRPELTRLEQPSSHLCSTVQRAGRERRGPVPRASGIFFIILSAVRKIVSQWRNAQTGPLATRPCTCNPCFTSTTGTLLVSTRINFRTLGHDPAVLIARKQPGACLLVAPLRHVNGCALLS